MFVFFKQKTAYEMRISDWSSDVCSSDLWRGTFYPPKHPQKRELDYAGQHLTGIEINGTYYGSQKPESFANWAASVPDDFRFSVKASRFATNRKVLADGAASVEKFLTQGLTRLGDRLGPILWQIGRAHV